MATNNPFVIQSGTLNSASLVGAAYRARKKLYPISTEPQSSGRRVAEIDKKLSRVYAARKQIDVSASEAFFMVPSDVVIDIMGNYNPLYSGRPKKVVLQLLNAVAGYVPYKGNYQLHHCGLGYCVPALVGVRGRRLRTSAAGLALLDHWGEKFPKFKPFLLAYTNNNKAREEIVSHCFDMAMGVRPNDFGNIDKLNETYRVKWEAREYRKMKKEQEEKQKRAEIMAQHPLLMNQSQQSAAQDAYARYHNMLKSQNTSASQVTPGGIWKKIF